MADALGDFRPLFDARSVWFLSIPDEQCPQTSHIASAGIAERSLIEYHAHFHVHDEWVLAAQRRSDFKLGAIYRGTQLVPPARLHKTYFWNEFLVRHGLTDMLSAIVDASESGRPTAFLSLQRHQGQEPFAVEHARRLARLSPHLRQVLRLHRRLAPALALGSTLAELVQRIEWPVLFVAVDGQLVDRNPAAVRALADGPHWLQLRQGRLWMYADGTWVPLQPRLAGLADAGSLRFDLATSHGRCATLESRLVHGAATDRAADHPVFAVCTLTAGPRDREQALREVFGLTPTEARVAMQIADGQAPGAISQRSGQSIATVRTHVAAVRQKMGVTRQAQIASRVLSL